MDLAPGSLARVPVLGVYPPPESEGTLHSQSALLCLGLRLEYSLGFMAWGVRWGRGV